MVEDAQIDERLRALRSAFDEAFAKAPGETLETRDLLVVGADDQRYALPLEDLTGVELTPPLTPLPSSPSALLGLANCRGRVVPVFALPRLLGDEPIAAPLARAGSAPPRYRLCALVAVERRDWVAFAFEHLFELARVPKTHDAPSTTAKVLRTGHGVVPILDVIDLKKRVITGHEEN